MRSSPRISINKLGEYLIATPGRRKTIVKNQKRPSPFIVAYYTAAEDAIAESIVNGHPEGFLAGKLSEFLPRQTSSDWDDNRRDLCVEAIDYFGEMIDDAVFPDFEKIRGGRDQEKITIRETLISVRPEILFKKDGQIVGGVKLMFNKTSQISQTEMEYVSTLLHHYIKEQYNQSAKPADCFSIDIFGGKMVEAPKSFKRRMNDIEASCEEIHDTWQRVE